MIVPSNEYNLFLFLLKLCTHTRLTPFVYRDGTLFENHSQIRRLAALVAITLNIANFCFFFAQAKTQFGKERVAQSLLSNVMMLISAVGIGEKITFEVYTREFISIGNQILYNNQGNITNIVKI